MPEGNFLQSSEMLGRRYQPPRRKKPWSWLVLFLLVLAIMIAAGFALAVYQELSWRQQRLNRLVSEVTPASENAILDNELIGQLTEAVGGTTTASTTTSTLATAKNSTRQLVEKTDRPSLGNASAGLVIVEFGDFECSSCKEAFPAIRTITNKYANDILFIFRNYPVIDDNSSLLAQASLCAADQNKFWQLHDRLFMNPSSIASLDDLKTVAVKAGLNWTTLVTCIDSEKYHNQVMSDMSDGLDAGVAGTPTFFVNGNKLEGAVTAATWEEIIKKYKELYK